jgi:hypothetical protein
VVGSTRAVVIGGKRVQDVLKGKRFEALRTGFVDLTARELPETPGSVDATPEELGHGWTLDRAPTTAERRRRALQPTTPNKGREKSSPLTRKTRLEEAGRRPSPVWKLRCGSTLAMISPGETAWQHHVYVPGPIQLQTAALAMGLDPSLNTLDNTSREESRSSPTTR